MTAVYNQTQFQLIPIYAIVPAEREIRETMSKEGLEELIEDIKRRGLINPVTVKPLHDGKFEVIAGMRRFEACKQAGWYEIPCIIREDSVIEAEYTKLAENFKREDVNPFDEGKYYQRLVDELGLTPKDIAEATNRSMGYIHARLDLIAGDPTLASAVQDGIIGLGVGLELNKLPTPEKRTFYLQYAIDYGATLRLVQQWVRDETTSHPWTGQEVVGVTSPLADFQPSTLQYECEVCGEMLVTNEVYTIRSSAQCKADVLRMRQILKEQEKRGKV
ncbi:MAG TPA: ParB/RepB/Spo0J family partition protein [Thermodesulfobacteriota bacterium]|nr:ParB/RepB/Spo0J family partition protein [Thermodesulfobacteriota bacterium]